VLDACRHRDLGTVIAVLGSHGVAQGQLAGLTGISQGRLSEYMTGKRKPRAASTFAKFADGLGMPSAAREALGLAPDQSPAGVGGQLPEQSVPDVGLSYPDTPAEATGNLTWLWRSDLSETSESRGPVDPGAWNDASLRWLVSTPAVDRDLHGSWVACRW
jgi:transcriptional regulator with XRE-family HTH domain